jgi:hypothetical protein
MPLKAPRNLVHETSTTTGTGDFTLTAVSGKQRFSDSNAFGSGATTNVFDYFISHRTAAEWERGTGHMSDTNTLVRDTVIESSNAHAAVNFSAGTKDVTSDIPAANQYGWQTILAPTSLPAAQSFSITDIPQNFSELWLSIRDASVNAATSHQLDVQVDSDNGASYDTTAGNYIYYDFTVGGLGTLASLVGGLALASATVTRSVEVLIRGYTSERPVFTGFQRSATNLTFTHGFYTSTTPINAIRGLNSAAVNFDAGTYSLRGRN